MIDIESATYKQLLNEYSKCEKLWSKYSYDCFGYYILAIHKRIIELGGWPPRTGK